MTGSEDAQILILDFGGQYAGLIEKRVRGMGVSVVRRPGTMPLDEALPPGAIGVIGSGGPDSVYADGAPQVDPAALSGELPYLGICYGMQLLAVGGGGAVERKDKREDGDTRIQVLEPGDALLGPLPPSQQVWMSHGDSVDAPPPGFHATARTDAGILAAMADGDGRRFGVQFHPEVNDTPYGNQLLSNFVLGVCGAQRDMDQGEELAAKQELIRQVVGDDNVLVFLSGGVDSSVVARMCISSLRPEQVFAVHVDHGFMREGESRAILERFGDFGFAPGHLVLAEETQAFLGARTRIPPPGAREVLGDDGTVAFDPPRDTWPETLPLGEESDPQAKRLIIGDTFMAVARRWMEKLGLHPSNTFLVQGTLYTDLIESGSREVSQGQADVIKFHHNDTPLVREFRQAGRVLEPNANWYKDDVRQVAVRLELGDDLARRRPFPGPGLAIRVLCADGPVAVEGGLEDLARSVDGNVADITDGTLRGRLVPVATVGVQGDARTYAPVALLSGAGDRNDPAFWQRAFAAATELPKREDRINRVAFQIAVDGDAPDVPAWDPAAVDDPTVLPRVVPTRLRPELMDLLRAVHRIGEGALRAADPDYHIAQMPLVLFPADLAGDGQRAVAIRGIITTDFMTGQPALPGRDLPWSFFETVSREVVALDGVGAVVIDLTTKPPATTCWE
jgi:GMP synthase (glutamine-hydrolysing)